MDSFKSFEDMFFGPLDSRYCLIFYVFMVIFFISLVVVVAKAIYDGFFGSKKMGSREIFMIVGGILYSALLYLHQRLLYSMCVKSNLPKV